jgi:drug/metabolite transporter (DMT)-like permease
VRRPAVAYLALAVASLLFGATFVVVKDAVRTLPPLGFVGWRFVLGAIVLGVFGLPRSTRTWREGTIAGLFLFSGYALQTQGLTTSTASNSGLITGLYVVLTPLAASAIARRLPRPLMIGGALLAFGGFAVLTLADGLRLEPGDLYTVACAAAFAGHIVYLSRVAHRHRVIPFTAVQLLVTGALGLGGSAVLERFQAPGAETWTAVVVTGVAVSAGAFFLQVWSQTIIGPARTAIVLALEPAFAAATGAIVLGERLGTRGLIGAALILGGIYVVLAGTGAEDELPTGEAVSPAH